MKRLTFFLVFVLFAGISVAQVKQKYVAVVETEIDEASGASADLNKADVRQVTAALRREAVKNLPKKDGYNVMTSETVQSMGGAVLEDCAEENCVIALGSKIGADYIVRGIISKLRAKLTLSVEVYETDNGTLVASFDDLVSSDNIEGLVKEAAIACAKMYKNFINMQNYMQKPKPEPEQEPVAQKSESKQAVQKQKPESKEKQKVLTYNVTVNASPVSWGNVSLIPNQTTYTRGTIVTVTAVPDSGYAFSGWLGAFTGKENPLVISIDGDKMLTAVFYPTRRAVVRTAASSESTGLTVIDTGMTFIDTRNNKTYKAVQIGNQTWMAENLNYQPSSGSWCYGNDDSNCYKYGRLYDWNTAKTACPTGWRLPSNQDWNTLVTTSGGSSAGKNLKSAEYWKYGGKGVDSYGFSALPGGVRYTRGGFGDIGVGGYYWTDTEAGINSAYRRRIDYDKDRVGELAVYSETKEDYGKRFGFSVRCLQNN